MPNLRPRGFTLIELLVVIAIIGILSAVILASLSTARGKGDDAAVQSNLSSIETQAEIFYENNHTYNSNPSGSGGSCSSSLTGSILADPTIMSALNNVTNDAVGNTVYCYVQAAGNGGALYAIQAQINGTTTSNTYWCVDSTGAAKYEYAPPPGNYCK